MWIPGETVWSFDLISSQLMVQGEEGCRNIKDGGDNILNLDDGPYFVYMVYRSFQRPSNAYLLDQLKPCWVILT